MTKIDGLLRLGEMELPVPPFGALDGRELDHLRTHQRLSDSAKFGIRAFVQADMEKGHPPLYALRFDCKTEAREPRPPITLLNVGLQGVQGKPVVTASGAAVPPECLRQLEPGRQFMLRNGPNRSCPSDEVMAAAEVCLTRYLDLFPAARDCDLIVQRMVFGIAEGVSGNGICCNYPESHGAERHFRGIYLPNQQGIQLRQGAWGTPQHALSELDRIHAQSYRALKEAHASASVRFGPNPYFEFTIEAGELYFLQYQERKRLVADD